MLRAIWAQAHERILGADGTMPWHVPEDLAHFSRMTAGSSVIMGRRTWQSFPERFRPLPGRRNIVVTRDAAFEAPGGETVSSLDDAIRNADGDAWIIGGGEIYRQTMHLVTEVAVTEIDLAVDGDTAAPELGAEWVLVSSDPETGWQTSRTGTRYRFRRYARDSARASLEA